MLERFQCQYSSWTCSASLHVFQAIVAPQETVNPLLADGPTSAEDGGGGGRQSRPLEGSRDGRRLPRSVEAAVQQQMEAAVAGVQRGGWRRLWRTAATAVVDGGSGGGWRRPATAEASVGARSPEGTASGPSTASGGRPSDADGRRQRRPAVSDGGTAPQNSRRKLRLRSGGAPEEGSGGDDGGRRRLWGRGSRCERQTLSPGGGRRRHRRRKKV